MKTTTFRTPRAATKTADFLRKLTGRAFKVEQVRGAYRVLPA